MKISIAWLEEILGTKISNAPAELSRTLLDLGFQTAAIETFRPCTGVITAQILEISKHPNADRLRIAKVTDGRDTKDVVCGAPNIEVGQKVFWAQNGAVLANGQKITETAIRGVKSPGMLCSAQELGIGEDHAGLWILEESTPVGVRLEERIRLEDTILELEITPNRPDALSHFGIARELAAALGLKPPNLEFKSETGLPSFPIEIENPADCPQYIARKIEGIRVQPSPANAQIRLSRCGIRAISNVVDITNLVVLEEGQPLHAFDADLLEGGEITVRRANPGEKILALDGKTYTLDPEILVIADAKKPVAIAGVMGGEATAVTSATKNILLESAIFDKKIVRHGRKKLNLSSESSYRFERGVSRWSCSTGSAQAQKMLLQAAGGRLTAYTDTAAAARGKTEKATSVTVRLDQVEKILGVTIPPSSIRAIFEKLGVFILSEDPKKFVVQIPSWRLDLVLEIDFIEELARFWGYEKIPSAGTAVRLPEFGLPGGKSSSAGRKKAASVLKALGFCESVNYGLVSKKDSELFFAESDCIGLENPLSEDQGVLRPSLILELTKNLRQNLAYQKKDIRLFEIGSVFRKTEGSPAEETHLAGIACGKMSLPDWRNKEPRPIDFFWIKGVVEKLLSEMGTDGLSLEPAQKAGSTNGAVLPDLGRLLHPAFDFQILKAKLPAGFFGVVHPKTAKDWDLPQPTVLFELDLGVVRDGEAAKKAAPVLRTPFIKRDCSIWARKDIRWGEIAEEIEQVGGPLLEDCALFDLYEDEKAGDLKSLSFTLTFRHPEKTLEDETANQIRDKIVAHLQKKLGAVLRQK